MNENLIESRTIEKEGIEYTLNIYYDSYCDLSWLGEYTNKQPDSYYIDRNEGVLIGIQKWDYLEFPEDKFNADSDGSDFLAGVSEKLQLTNPEVNFEIDIYDYYQQGDDTWFVEFEYKEILAETPKCTYGRNGQLDYLYYVSCNHLNPEIKQEIIDKWGLDDLIQWTLNDYKRLEEYYKEYWYMRGFEIVLEGESTSLWGIESDCEDTCENEVIENLIYELKSKIPEIIQDLRNKADRLEKLSL